MRALNLSKSRIVVYKVTVFPRFNLILSHYLRISSKKAAQEVNGEENVPAASDLNIYWRDI